MFDWLTADCLFVCSWRVCLCEIPPRRVVVVHRRSKPSVCLLLHAVSVVPSVRAVCLEPSVRAVSRAPIVRGALLQMVLDVV